MAFARVEIHVSGLSEAQARMLKLSGALSNFTGALTSLGTSLIKFYSDTVFGSEGKALLGQRWAELKPNTEKYKNKRWYGRGILVRSGSLQESFYDRVEPEHLFIGNRMAYFPYHQLGTATGPGRGHNIPSRPMIGVNQTVESLIKGVIETDVKAKIDGAI